MRKRSNHLAWFVLANFTVVLLLTGCGTGGPPPPKRYKVSGTVNLDGKPLETGMIKLVIVKGDADTGMIKNGIFTMEALPGEKRVEIYASKPSDKNVAGKDSVKESVSLIPEQYNTKSTLKETVKEGANEFKFELKSGK